MLLALVLQEALTAAASWFIIDIAKKLAWTIQAQSPQDGNWWVVHSFLILCGLYAGAYGSSLISWYFVETTGFTAYEKYVNNFDAAYENKIDLLHDAKTREDVEPYVGSEAFSVIFRFIYDLEFNVSILLLLVFNSLVLGDVIDGNYPYVFLLILMSLLVLQYIVRRPMAQASLHNQKHTNAMMAWAWAAWDNVLSGNKYNYQLWQATFRQRLAKSLRAQLRLVFWREGWGSISNLYALIIILGYTSWMAITKGGDAVYLVGLAASLPKQFDMLQDMRTFSNGISDWVAVFARIKGLCYSMQPSCLGIEKQNRIKFEKIKFQIKHDIFYIQNIDELLNKITALHPRVGRIKVRAANGVGKSTILVLLKIKLQAEAYYLPCQDRMQFQFNTPEDGVYPNHAAVQLENEMADEDEQLKNLRSAELSKISAGWSSGERQMLVLKEIVNHTHHPYYLLDEWSANLDAHRLAEADQCIDALALRAVVIEVSHHH